MVGFCGGHLQNTLASSELENVDDYIDALLHSVFDKKSSMEYYFEIVSDEIRVYESIIKSQRYEVQLDVSTRQGQFDDHDQSKSQIRNSDFHGVNVDAHWLTLTLQFIKEDTGMSFVAPKRINPSFFGEATERKRGELMLKRTFFHIELGTVFEKQFV